MAEVEESGGERVAPLLQKSSGILSEVEEEEERLVWRSWVETKKLWRIVGPAMASRVALCSIGVITQSCAGHLGDLELASISIAITVVNGFSFGLMLGMASAMETLCGQAYGAKRHKMLGIYLQRSWIVLFISAILLLPTYFFARPVLEFVGEPPELARKAGEVSIWLIPLHLSFVFLFPMQRFLQCQLKHNVNAVICVAALILHACISWLFTYKLQLGLFATVLTVSFSWWIIVLGQMVYVLCGGCPLSWNGFSMEAFSDLWEFIKLSAASGVMLCLENWYYRILILLAGNLKNAEIAVDALSICMSINGWEMMIPLAFFVGIGVRVANELGAGNGKNARFATIISVANSLIIGIFFWFLIIIFHNKLAILFTPSSVVINAVDKLSILLAFTILLNSVQPILSGVAVGSGWQRLVVYVNIGSYYIIGVPIGVLLGWAFHLGVLGIWAGMIGGTAIQTIILAILTIRCDWEKEAMIASARMEIWGVSRKP